MRSAAAVAVLALVLLAVPSTAQAAPSWSAQLDNDSVRIDSMASMSVIVTNDGPGDVELRSVRLIVDWGIPSEYALLSGAAIVQSGSSLRLSAPMARVPTVEPGAYPAYIVVSFMADGALQERVVSAQMSAREFSFEPLGVPEWLFLPFALAAAAFLVTIITLRLAPPRSRPPVKPDVRVDGAHGGEDQEQ